jgi:hypothetical protein
VLDAVQAGIERDRVRREQAKLVDELRERFSSLTSREQEVLALVITGRPNKQIAYQLKLSEMTVKVHRSQAMHKGSAVFGRSCPNGRQARRFRDPAATDQDYSHARVRHSPLFARDRH